MNNKTGVFCIAGNDEYLVYQKSITLFNEYAKNIEDPMAQEVMDAKIDTLANLEALIKNLKQAVETPSLFSPQKIIWLKGANFLGGNTRLSQSEGCKVLLETLQEILSSVDKATTTIILSASPIDARTKTVKWLQKNHETLIIQDDGDGDPLSAFIQTECTPLNISFEQGAKEVLSKKVQGSRRLLHEEVKKLSTFAYTQGLNITQSMVFELVPDFGEGDFFEPVEAFFASDARWTTEALKRYFFIHKEGRPLISALQNRNRLLIQLMALGATQSITHLDPNRFNSLKNTYQGTYGSFESKSSYNLFTQNVWYIKRLLNTRTPPSLSKLIQQQKTFLSCFKAILLNPHNQEDVFQQLLLSNLCSTSKE